MRTKQLKDLVVAALEDLKAKDIEVLDVHKLTSITDMMVIASGTSTRHVKALADNVLEKAKAAQKMEDSGRGGKWKPSYLESQEHVHSCAHGEVQ